ncbi:cation transporting ATPase C-terminal domain-containing protein [Candidatus Gottesmanbacteria bacterium]|nr:cation transporting ATPase C-terminal domain-containing protein [Candidatus Gottesmanbacteria bacterium]
MLTFGPASSLFDFITFGVLIWYFKAQPPLFQTGWFVESLVTQTLIVFSIRTAVVPFFNSRPNIWFSLGLILMSGVTLVLPFTPLGAVFSFVRLPVTFYLIVIAIVFAYTLLVELLKLWFYRLERAG